MVIDSSALIAIVLGEPERRSFIEAIAAADVRLVAAPTMFEASMVALARSDARLRDLRDFCERGEVERVAFGPDHIDLALDAFRRYGKGRHPAGLNMGDCVSYALARATAEPLLFKGEDFSQTDIKRAV